MFQCRSVLWQEVCCRLFYLCDVHTFEKDEMELNATVFAWPENILSVFQHCDEVFLAGPRQRGVLIISHRLPTDVIVSGYWDSQGERDRWADG